MKNFLLISFSVLLITSTFTFAQHERQPADSIGFCWNAPDMDALIKFLETNNPQIEKTNKSIIAAISPHDDYLYAGNIYYPLYKNINSKEIIIFGVTHATARRAINDPKGIIIFDEFNKWPGPYSKVSISPLREKLKSRLNKSDFLVSNKAHGLEHSIEALIPFIQFYNRNFKITPLMVTAMSYEEMHKTAKELSNVIVEYIKQNNLTLGKDIFFLFSNDANHYGEDFNNSPFGLDSNAHHIATQNDKKIIDEYINGEISENSLKRLTAQIWDSPNNQNTVPLWCGRYSIIMGLLTTNMIVKSLTGKNLKGQLLKYSDSLTEKVLPVKNTGLGTTAAYSYKHWCGFFSSVFFID